MFELITWLRFSLEDSDWWIHLIVIPTADVRWCFWFECVQVWQVCCGYTGMTFGVKIEAHSNDITDRPHDSKPRCTVCDKDFKEKDIWMTTIRYIPEKSCIRQCDKAFSGSEHLNQHMTGDKQYNCSLCDESFSHSSSWHTHRPHAHSNRRPYGCPYCVKVFNISRDLTFRVYTHTGARPYLFRHCSDCFNFITSSKHICSSYIL